jgi:hypothetical protein
MLFRKLYAKQNPLVLPLKDFSALLLRGNGLGTGALRPQTRRKFALVPFGFLDCCFGFRISVFSTVLIRDGETSPGGNFCCR